MTKVVVHVLEVIEVDPVHGETVSRPQFLERSLKLFMEMKSIGNLGKCVVASEPGDLLFRLTPFGDVYLQVHPATIGESLGR